MDITWLGHAAVRVRTRQAALVMDPTDRSAGLDMARPAGEIATISRPEHPHHNHVKGIKGDPVVVDGPGEYEILGSTIDDAAGEAFDKIARFMGLGFPGGPALDKAAEGGDPDIVKFPRALRDQPYNFSFSGLKTSVVTYLEKAKASNSVPPLPDVAAAVQEAIVDVLVAKTFNAVEATGVMRVAGGGGVLANRRLRFKLAEEADKRGVAFHLPSPALCTDNGAMIAAAGEFRLERGDVTPWGVDVSSSLRLGG